MSFYTKNKTIFWIVILIIALLAGYLGSWLYWATFSKVNTNDLISYNPNSSVIIQEPRNVVVQQDAKASGTITAVQGSLVGIFKKNNLGEYNLTDNQAQALIITSDGWLISNSALVNANNLSTYVAITTDRKIYEIDKVIKGDVSNFFFLHVKDGRDLPILSFVATKDLRPGQTVLGINWFDDSWLTVISQTDKNLSAVKSSDVSNQEILLQDVFGKDNFVLADLSNSVVGLIDANGKVKPMAFFAPAIESLLLDDLVLYPSLGINYKKAELIASPELTKGALVVSVEKNSPAAISGIIPNDLILSVNGKDLDLNNDLADFISEYKPMDKITIRYQRVGETKDLEVVLK